MAKTKAAQLEEQAAEADRHLDEMDKARKAQTDTPAVETPTEPQQPVVPAAQPSTEDVVPAVPAAEEQPVMKAEYDRVKAALATLQGKYTKEVPRFSEQIRELKDELAGMTAKLNAQPATPQTPPKPAHLRHVDEAEVENLDPSAVDLQSRMAEGVAEKVVEKVNERVARLEADLAQERQARTQTRQDGIWAQVNAVHPGADVMDRNDPMWEAFLDTTDDNTGFKNREIGIRAMATGNAKTLINLISRYKGTAEDSDTTGSPSQVSKTVEAQIKPKTARTASAPRSVSKPTLKASDQRKLVVEFRQGRWKGKEAEFEAKLDEFQDAAMEGRYIED